MGDSLVSGAGRETRFSVAIGDSGQEKVASRRTSSAIGRGGTIRFSGTRRR